MVSAAIRAWQENVNNTLGAGTVAIGSDLAIPGRFTSGSLALDVALGGGWPGNTWNEIYGPFSSGKTATLYKTVAANQAKDPDLAVFWVAGEAYDTDQASALGVDNSRVVVAPSQNLEMSLELLLQAASSKEFGIAILDSYPSQVAAEEDEKSMLENTVAVNAKRFNQFWRKAGPASFRALDGSEPMFLGLIVNQPREKIGGFSPYGTPETTPGGRGKDFAYHVRLKVHRDQWIEEPRIDQDSKSKPFKVGQTIAWTTTKNKSASPQRVAKTDFYFEDCLTMPFRRGEYDLGKEYVGVGVLLGVVKRSGSWHEFGNARANGKDAMADLIAADRDLRAALEAAVLNVVAHPELREMPVAQASKRAKRS